MVTAENIANAISASSCIKSTTAGSGQLGVVSLLMMCRANSHCRSIFPSLQESVSKGSLGGQVKPGASFSIASPVKGNAAVYETTKGMFEGAGIEVVEESGEEAQAILGDKKASLNTGKANHEGAEVPAISSDDVAKI